MSAQRDEFEDLLDKEFREIENLLDRHYIYAKEYRGKFDVDSIRLIREHLKVTEGKLLNLYKRQRIL